MLYRFCSQPCSDGSGPVAGLIADERGGALYGTTLSGGSSGVGTVFKLTVVDPLAMMFAPDI